MNDPLPKELEEAYRRRLAGQNGFRQRIAEATEIGAAADARAEQDALDAAYAKRVEEKRIAERRRGTPWETDFARGAAQGLSNTGSAALRAFGAVTRMRSMAPGAPNAMERQADQIEREAQDYYDPQGTAGAAGRVTGRIAGEMATAMAGGRGTSNLIAKAAPEGLVARGLQSENVLARVMARNAPFAPIDAAMGYGGNEEGIFLPGRLGSAAENVAFGLGLGGIIDAPGAYNEVVESRALRRLAEVNAKNARVEGRMADAAAAAGADAAQRADQRQSLSTFIDDMRTRNETWRAREEEARIARITRAQELARQAREQRAASADRSALDEAAQIDADLRARADARARDAAREEELARAREVGQLDAAREQYANPRHLPVRYDPTTIAPVQGTREAGPATAEVAGFAAQAAERQQTMARRAVAEIEAYAENRLSRSATTPQGRLKSDLRNVHPDALERALAERMERLANNPAAHMDLTDDPRYAEAQALMQGGHREDALSILDDTGEPILRRGATQAVDKAQAVQTQKAIDRIQAEIRRRAGNAPVAPEQPGEYLDAVMSRPAPRSDLAATRGVEPENADTSFDFGANAPAPRPAQAPRSALEEIRKPVAPAGPPKPVTEKAAAAHAKAVQDTRDRLARKLEDVDEDTSDFDELMEFQDAVEQAAASTNTAKSFKDALKRIRAEAKDAQRRAGKIFLSEHDHNEVARAFGLPEGSVTGMYGGYNATPGSAFTDMPGEFSIEAKVGGQVRTIQVRAERQPDGTFRYSEGSPELADPNAAFERVQNARRERDPRRFAEWERQQAETERSMRERWAREAEDEAQRAADLTPGSPYMKELEQRINDTEDRIQALMDEGADEDEVQELVDEYDRMVEEFDSVAKPDAIAKIEKLVAEREAGAKGSAPEAPPKKETKKQRKARESNSPGRQAYEAYERQATSGGPWSPVVSDQLWTSSWDELNPPPDPEWWTRADAPEVRARERDDYGPVKADMWNPSAVADRFSADGSEFGVVTKEQYQRSPQAEGNQEISLPVYRTDGRGEDLLPVIRRAHGAFTRVSPSEWYYARAKYLAQAADADPQETLYAIDQAIGWYRKPHNSDYKKPYAGVVEELLALRNRIEPGGAFRLRADEYGERPTPAQIRKAAESVTPGKVLRESPREGELALGAATTTPSVKPYPDRALGGFVVTDARGRQAYIFHDPADRTWYRYATEAEDSSIGSRGFKMLSVMGKDDAVQKVLADLENGLVSKGPNGLLTEDKAWKAAQAKKRSGRKGAAPMSTLTPLATTGAGAAIGAAADEDNRLRGAAIGAGLGAGIGRGLGKKLARMERGGAALPKGMSFVPGETGPTFTRPRRDTFVEDVASPSRPLRSTNWTGENVPEWVKRLQAKQSAMKTGAPVERAVEGVVPGALGQPDENALKRLQAGAPVASADTRRPYANVPDSLMGFTKSGTNKGFDEQKFSFILPVKVRWEDGMEHVDEIRGLNLEHALERARRNWDTAVSWEAAGEGRRVNAGNRPGFGAAPVVNALGTGAVTGTVAMATGDKENAKRNLALGFAAGAAGGGLVTALAGRSARPKSALFQTNPDVAAVRGTIATGARPEPTPNRLLTPLQRWYQGLVASQTAAEKVGVLAGTGPRVQQAVARSHGWEEAADQFMRDHFMPVVQQAKGIEDDAMALMKAERDIDLRQRGAADKSDIPLQQLGAARNALRANPEVVTAARNMQKYYRRLAELQLQEGLISPQQFRDMVDSEDFYTPFVREWDAVEPIARSSGGGIVQRSPGNRRMNRTMQAQAKTVDPYEMAALDTGELFQKIARQRVTNAMVEAYHANPGVIEQFLRPLGDNVSPGARTIEFNVGGTRQKWEVRDADLYDSLASLDRQTLKTYQKVLRGFAATLRTGTTLMPDFVVANWTRDTAGAAVQQRSLARQALVTAGTGAAGNIALGDRDQSVVERGLKGAAYGLGVGVLSKQAAKSAAAIGDIIMGREVYKQFKRDGGMVLGYYPKSKADARRLLEQMRRSGIDPKTVLNPGSWVNAMKMIGSAVEQSTRLAKYKDAVKSGASTGEAVLAAHDVSVRFGQHGASTRGITNATAFWNSSVQGWDKLIRMVKNPRTAAVAAATITAPSIALWMTNKDDPDYWARPTWERNVFWLVKKDDGSGDFWRIPKPFQLGILFASLPERMLEYTAMQSPDILSSASPFKGTKEPGRIARRAGRDMLAQSFDGVLPVPTLASVLGEQFFNMDVFRDRKIVTNEKLPREQQYDEGTSSAGYLAGRVTEGVDPRAAVSPQRFDHAIRALTGGGGQFVSGMADKAARQLGLDDRPRMQGGRRPFIGRFETQPGLSDAQVMYRERLDAANKVYRGMENLFTTRASRAEIQAYVDKHRPQLREYYRLEAFSKLEKELSDMRWQVSRRQDLSDAERKAKYQQIARAGERLAAAAINGTPPSSR